MEIATINAALIPAPQRALTPKADKFARAQARGWNDVRDGKGFREDYETWPRKKQWAYERGRTRAIIARTSLLPGRTNIAVWKRDETIHNVLQRTVGYPRSMQIIEETSVVRQRKEKVKS